MPEGTQTSTPPAAPAVLRVLAVDDEDDILLFYREALAPRAPRLLATGLPPLTPAPSAAERWSADDYEVTPCHTGEEALEAARAANRDGQPFAIAFIDVRLPRGLDGIRTAELIRQIEPAVEIVIVTGYSDWDPAEIVRRVPPADKLLYLRKPVHLAEVRQFCAALGAKWRVERDIRDAHSGLETAVRERTAQLAQANNELRREIEERALAEQHQARLATAVDQAAESIVVTDASGVIVYANPAFERNTGYSLTEAIGQSIGIVQSDHHQPEFHRQLWDTIRRGEVWKGRFVNRRKDGSPYEEEATISPVRNPAGEITHFVGVQRDITHEARLERQLQQAQKMEAIGTLAGGIAHDFNNLLMGILGYIDLATGSLPHDPTAACGFLHEATLAGKRARDLVRQILAFSRQSDKARRPLQPQYIVKEALKLLQASFPSTVKFRQNVSSDTGAVLGDPAEIQQLVVNLCVNAEYAMRPDGGILEVTLRNVEVGRALAQAHEGLAVGSYVELIVSDTGCGMEPAVLKRIFDPFFTTKGVGEGTGMGLAVVHGIVTSYSGAIAVQSEPGCGTTFHVWLPREDRPGVNETPLDQPVAGGDERILLVDDEEIAAVPAARMLERLGYRVTMRTDSLQALDDFKAAPGEFDLLIADQTMPQMTGMTLIRQIKAIRPDLPVILCTGYGHTIPMREAIGLNIREAVAKPYYRYEIGNAVRRALDQSKSKEPARRDT